MTALGDLKHGRVLIRRLRAHAFRVHTEPPLDRFDKRFYKPLARKPFDRALGYAATSAALLGFDLVDETGTVAPDLCRALVAEIAVRERAANGEPHLRVIAGGKAGEGIRTDG